MQTNHDSRIALIPAFKNSELQTLSVLDSPVHYIAELARPFAIILKGINWAGLFGDMAGSKDSVSMEAKRVAYQIKQTLGIKGFVLNLRSSSALATGLPACWETVRPCVETIEFEDASAQIWSQAASLAEGLGDTDQKSLLRLSHDEAAQLQLGLDFYHFLLPRMLVLSSALRLACDLELSRRGIVQEERAQDLTVVREDGLHGLFQDIRGILVLHCGQRAVALPLAWSKYLAAASARLRPLIQGENFHRASAQLHKTSRQSAPGFQERIGVVELESLEAIAKEVVRFESRLPSLIISLTLLELYLRPADSLQSDRPLAWKAAPAARPEMAPNKHVAHQPLFDLPAGIFLPPGAQSS